MGGHHTSLDPEKCHGRPNAHSTTIKGPALLLTPSPRDLQASCTKGAVWRKHAPRYRMPRPGAYGNASSTAMATRGNQVDHTHYLYPVKAAHHRLFILCPGGWP